MLIFSGDNSVELWKDIRKIKCKKTRMAVYNMGCHCQRLESEVEDLRSRMTEMENREGDKARVCMNAHTDLANQIKAERERITQLIARIEGKMTWWKFWR